MKKRCKEIHSATLILAHAAIQIPCHPRNREKMNLRVRESDGDWRAET